MTDFIHIEPAHERRADFAVWVLAQDVQPVTTSTGFSVPLDLYPTIPERLLNGAFVDGYHYNRPHPQPVAEAPLTVPEEPVADRPAPAPRKPRRSRRAVTE